MGNRLRWLLIVSLCLLPTAAQARTKPRVSTQPQVSLTLAARVQQAANKSQGKGEWEMGLIVGAITPTDRGIWYFGRQAPGQGVPTFDSAFRIGSVTKTMTGALLALQNGSGMYVGPCSGPEPGKTLTSLADALAAACPDCGALPTPRKSITLVDLADHHSGLPRKVTQTACTTHDFYLALTSCEVHDLGASIGATCGPADCPEWCGSCSGSSCNACKTPGSSLYSNWGYTVLGHLLASHAGTSSWHQLDHDRVLAPLGMKHTLVDGESFAGLDKAIGYRCSGSGANASCTADTTPYPSPAQPAGGLWSTGPDMMRYLLFAMGQPPLEASPAADQLYAARPLIFCVRAGTSGLGWFEGKLSGPTTTSVAWSKDGGWASFSTYIAWLPAQGVGAFAMSNAGGGDGVENIVKGVLTSYVP